jgi:flagellar biosynthesis GTPase FlhF
MDKVLHKINNKYHASFKNINEIPPFIVNEYISTINNDFINIDNVLNKIKTLTNTHNIQKNTTFKYIFSIIKNVDIVKSTGDEYDKYNTITLKINNDTGEIEFFKNAEFIDALLGGGPFNTNGTTYTFVTVIINDDILANIFLYKDIIHYIKFNNDTKKKIKSLLSAKRVEKRETIVERKQIAEAEAERKQIAEAERKQIAEAERERKQREAEAERKQRAEAERKQIAEADEREEAEIKAEREEAERERKEDEDIEDEEDILQRQIEKFTVKYSQQFIIKIEHNEYTQYGRLIERISVK